jgi:hypothetical protein
LSTQQYPISTNTNSTPIDTEPPFGWVNTGENGNNNTGSGDNNPDGRLTVSVGTTNFTNANFGIEQPPVPGSGSNTASNPGGNIQVPVPTNTFTNISNSTDSLPGTVVAIRIVEFPEYVTSMVINGVTYTPLNFPSGGVTIPTDIYGNPSQPVTVDPAFNGPGNIHINFVAIDNAGIESSNKGLGSAELLLTVPLSGNVFNDLNGLIGTPFNTVDGSPTNTGNPLYAVLYNNSTGIVEQIDTIPAGGGYSFDVKAEDYTVYLTTTLPTINQTTTPTVTPPSGWVNTGENIGTTAGNDGFVNGILPIGTIAAPVLNANFGLAPIPEADPKLFIGLDPTTLRFLPTGNTTYPNAMPLNNTSGSINGSVTLTDGTMPGKVSGDDFNNGRISGATGTEGLMTFVTDGKVYDPNNNALELTNTVLVYNFEGQNFILTPNPTATDPSYAFWNPTTGQYEIENFNSNNLTVWFNTEGQSGFTFNYGWINEAGVESNIAPYTMNATGPLAILPVELTSFEVIVVSNDVQLTWTTASEKNNDRFEIERSTDGINFVKVGTVKGNGTTSLPQLYNFMDENPGVGVHYYRLKQVDFDTQFEYSKIKSAEIVGTVTIRSYPNPAQNLLNIEVTDTRLGEINGTIVLYNAAGAEMIRESMVGSNRIQLDVSQLPSGSYLLRYQSEEMISTFKVIISH